MKYHFKLILGLKQLEEINCRNADTGDVVTAYSLVRYENEKDMAELFRRADEQLYAEKKRLKQAQAHKERAEQDRIAGKQRHGGGGEKQPGEPGNRELQFFNQQVSHESPPFRSAA